MIIVVLAMLKPGDMIIADRVRVDLVKLQTPLLSEKAEKYKIGHEGWTTHDILKNAV